MKSLFLIGALLASATAASGSVTYNFQSQSGFGTADWQFTVLNYLSAPGTDYITIFDSASSTYLGSIIDAGITDPFSASPDIRIDGIQGSTDFFGWTGPFDQPGIYSAQDATLTISGAPSAPEPSSLALIGAGGILLALARRRRWISRKQLVS